MLYVTLKKTMSAINQYNHKILLAFECPSTFPFIYQNENSRILVVYQLLEDISDEESSFDGKRGDIIIGGGKGEADSLRLTTEKALLFFSDKETEQLEFDNISEIFKSFWSNNNAFIFCEGYRKLGWEINQDIDYWLAENICKLIVYEIDEYKKYQKYYSDKSKLKALRI